MAAFLIDRQQCLTIGDTVSNIGYPNGGVPQGTLSGRNNVLVQINDMQTPCAIFKYVDDSTILMLMFVFALVFICYKSQPI